MWIHYIMSHLHLSKRLRACVAVLIFIVVPAQHLQASEWHEKFVIGSWKLTAVLDSSEISALDDDEAQQLVGHVMTISRDQVQLDDRVCSSPGFEVTKTETYKLFREEAHASAEKLGLPNPVTAIEISCTDVFIKSRNRLVVHWKGFFFDAIRMPGKSH